METQLADRPSPQAPSTSGVQLVMEVVDELMKRRGPAGYRVVYKTNPRGEHVVAVIWPPEP
jgi:hypothetical protein